MDELQPRPDETLGQYLRRLRELARLTQAQVMRATAGFAPPRRITSWLARVEADAFAHPDAEKLAVLAQIYGERIGIEIPVDLLRVKAGYDPLDPVGPPGPPPEWARALAARPEVRGLARKLLALPADDLAAVGAVVDHLLARDRQAER
jgi:transcriptional regulator with XRE-family HTH domain